MAIKLKKPTSQVPQALDQIATDGFRYSTLEKHFKELAGDRRNALKGYCEHNDDGFDLTEKTITCTDGKITLTERNTFDVDVDLVQELIDSGEVTLTTILQCVSFRATDLKTALGSKFEEVTTQKSSQSFTFKPSAEFKAEVIEEFGGGVEVEKPAPKKAAKKKTPAKKATVKKALKTDTENSDVEADLDSMLGV